MRVYFSDWIADCRTRLVKGVALRRDSPVLESLDRLDLMSVQFTPFGFHRLFHEDASRFTDGMMEFVDLVGEPPTDRNRLCYRWRTGKRNSGPLSGFCWRAPNAPSADTMEVVVALKKDDRARFESRKSLGSSVSAPPTASTISQDGRREAPSISPNAKVADGDGQSYSARRSQFDDPCPEVKLFRTGALHPRLQSLCGHQPCRLPAGQRSFSANLPDQSHQRLILSDFYKATHTTRNKLVRAGRTAGRMLGRDRRPRPDRPA